MPPFEHWIREQRYSTYHSWTNLNFIVRESDHRWIGASKHLANLPGIVDHATGRLFHIFPGLFIIVVQFVLTEPAGRRLNDVLHREFQTIHEPDAGGGVVFHSPVEQKREAVTAARRQARQECIEWLRGVLPGSFAKTGDLDTFPTCDFVTLELGRPADVTAGPRSYLRCLDFDTDIDWWSCEALPGLLLRSPRGWNEDKLALTLAANYHQAFTDMQLEVYGGRTRTALSLSLDELDTTATIWALNALLRLYERNFSSLGERVANSVAKPSLAELISDIAALEVAVLQLSPDALILASEASNFCSAPQLFHHDVAVFVPVRPLWPLATVHNPAGSGWSRLKSLWKREPIAATAEGEPHLFEGVRLELVRRCERLQQTEVQVRQLIQAGSSLANARSQQRLAKTNVWLQRVVALLAAVSLTVSIVSLFVTCNTQHESQAARPAVVATPQVPTASPRLP